ncbi:polysaccharide pyruvyl transferase family protein [Altererythrobacter salegens]|uniref:Polysaccharide pyruvyl transferase family protein n=1 Tax=Croceibacterium salegens TaxID=1737568 RepID=A0A6I4T0I5_9SPHN|nr:polysaccharide pyruvyl transferase family protein [Croceibacterium salegens]MXO60736.1 polysaccharide pyruvyl transferase family protein [Croceibacterium salegens]
MNACDPALAAARRVTLLDTAVASTNLGDQIIMEAVRAGLRDVLAGTFVTSVASHDRLGPKGRALIRNADVAIAGGSNLISSRMWFRSVWKLGLRDAFLSMNTVLMGIGWYQFQNKPDPYSRWLLRRVLHPTALHSVRDSHAKAMLAGIGIVNVVNTGCPTLWDLANPARPPLPTCKAAEVVTTVNTYIKDPAADRRMLEILKARYGTVYAWIQTAEDGAYLRELAQGIEIIEPSLAAYDELLTSARDLDYVGNRLHGGIRAMQKGRRAIIVAIDNRAQEMGRDFALPIVARTNFERLEAMIAGPLEIAVRPPLGDIAAWKAALARTIHGPAAGD